MGSKNRKSHMHQILTIDSKLVHFLTQINYQFSPFRDCYNKRIYVFAHISEAYWLEQSPLP